MSNSESQAPPATGATAATFGTVAQNYRLARPGYPAEIFDHMAGLAASRELAADIGCGSGQSSAGLARHFRSVLACDRSLEQVRAAPADTPNLRFFCSPAERLPLRDACADLVLAAQAAHWFDLPAFYAEARRVAKPGAALVLLSYAEAGLGHGPAQKVLEDFYRRVVAGWWPKGRELVEARYAPLLEAFPFPRLEMPQNKALRLEVDLEGLLLYLQSMSAYARLRAALVPDPIPAARADFAKVWPDSGKARLELQWPLTCIAARLE